MTRTERRRRRKSIRAWLRAFRRDLSSLSHQEVQLGMHPLGAIQASQRKAPAPSAGAERMTTNGGS